MAKSTNTRSNAASKAAAVANDVVAKAKAKVAIFTRTGAKVPAILFLTVSDKERAPVFGGSIGATKVSAFLRHPVGKTPFLSFVDSNGTQVGTGNVLVRADGNPVVKALLGNEGETKTEAWFSVSKNVTDDMLAALGAKMDKLHVNTKEAATA